VGALLAGVAVFFVGRALVREWDDVRESLAHASAAWIAVAAVLAAVGMTAIAVPWRRALQLLGADLDGPDVVARYYLGEIGKYVPGGIWPVVGRGELARRAGVPRVAAYGSVALSLAALYLAAMFVVVASAPAIIGGGDPGRYLWVLVLLPLGVMGLHDAVLERVRRTTASVLARPIDTPIPRWRDSLRLLVLYLPAWLAIGTATWAVARGLGQDVGWFDVAPAAVLSWIVGFVLVPVPGGVGVREAAFVAASGLDPGVGAAVAVVARVLFVAVDTGGAALGSTWLARQARNRVRTPSGVTSG
jgi:glycosyltransferase 2 family protein